MFAAWKGYDGVSHQGPRAVHQFKDDGRNIVWGPAAKTDPLVKTALLMRNIRLVVAFITRDSRGTIFTIKKAAAKRKPIDVFAWDCDAPEIQNSHIKLTSPAYLGARRWKGQVFENTHPPITSETMFNQVQELLKTRPHPKATQAPFQRLLICGDCLSPMTPSYSLKRTKCRYYYYRCSRRSHYGKTVKTCTIKAIGFIEIEKRITDALQQLATPDHLKAIEIDQTHFFGGSGWFDFPVWNIYLKYRTQNHTPRKQKTTPVR